MLYSSLDGYILGFRAQATVKHSVRLPTKIGLSVFALLHTNSRPNLVWGPSYDITLETPANYVANSAISAK